MAIPIKVKVYSVKETQLHIGENRLEIIFCLKGKVRFDYGYEDLILLPGEYVSVGEDLGALQAIDEESICASILIDLKHYQKKHPYILTELFVCEGAEDALSPQEEGAPLPPYGIPYPNSYPYEAHKKLKGVLITFLYLIASGRNDEEMKEIFSDRIVELLVNHFTIYHYYFGENVPDDKTRMLYQKMFSYIIENLDGPIRLSDLAEKFNYSESFVSKFMKKFGLSFQNRLTYLRAVVAEKNLIKSNDSILKLAIEHGFSDVRYFYQAAEQASGKKVTDLRAQYKKMKAEEYNVLPEQEINECLPALLIEHYKEIFTPDPSH
jgi:AraC-like DNA-binding protein